MRKLGFVFVLIGCFVASGTGEAAPIRYYASLNGANENPAVPTPATGSAIVTYDPVAQTLRVQVEFSDLIGTTTAAHIHCCVAAPGNVGVATQVPSFAGFPLGVTSGSMDQTFDLTLASSFNAAFISNPLYGNGVVANAEAALAAGLEAGQAYLNIHSTFRPGGEIRGFLVPEPATLLLMGLAAGALGVRRRRRNI